MTFASEILTVSADYNLNPDLITAQMQVESGGNAWAWNPEPVYRYFWDVVKRAPFRPITAEERASEFPPKDFPCLAGDPDQEWWAQQASWGLMQVMGALARERGFTRPYLIELCDPLVNLHVGCAHLASLLKWSKGNVTQALAAYNGGKGGNERPPFRNQAYATKVLQAHAKLTSPQRSQ